jgi:hypothetical protein
MYMATLNGINFQWTAGKSPRGQSEVRFTKLKEFKKTRGTVSFLGEDKTKFPKLVSWTLYAKSRAIKVINY